MARIPAKGEIGKCERHYCYTAANEYLSWVFNLYAFCQQLNGQKRFKYDWWCTLGAKCPLQIKELSTVWWTFSFGDRVNGCYCAAILLGRLKKKINGNAVSAARKRDPKLSHCKSMHGVAKAYVLTLGDCDNVEFGWILLIDICLSFEWMWGEVNTWFFWNY